METPGTGIPHRCLHVAEVQAIIFGLLAREDCVCLARTCGLFYNEAMNAVWAEVKSLVPFVRCMPLDAVAESNSANPIWSGSDTTITFCKEPTSSDWQSFSKHAHRVRKFLDTDILFTHIYSYQPNGEVEHTIPVSVFQLATSAWQTITHFICQHHSTDSAPLFPNLVALQARSITDVFFRSYLPYICGVTLQTFILEFGVPINPGLGGGFYSTFSELLPAMRTSWPHLSSVEINAPECSIQGQATKHVEEISVWIKNLAQLHFLHVHTGCHPSLIQNLSELPFLHTLDLKGEPGTTSDPTLNFAPSSLSSRFQSLKELKLITYLPDSPVPLLRALNGSNTLTKITLAFGCMRGLPSFTETPQAIEAIYHLPAVNFLDLSFAHYKATTGLISVGTIPPLDASLLSKFYTLRRLRHLRLSGFFDIPITDRDLQNAANAWTELEYIELALDDSSRSRSARVNQTTRLTLIGVQALYNGCPNLKAVDLFVNERLPITNDRLDLPVARPRAAANAMEELSLRFRPTNQEFRIGSMEYVPIVVRLLFPQLKRFNTCYCFQFLVDALLVHRLPYEDWIEQVQARWITYRDMELEEVRAILEEKWAALNAEDGE